MLACSEELTFLIKERHEIKLLDSSAMSQTANLEALSPFNRSTVANRGDSRTGLGQSNLYL